MSDDKLISISSSLDQTKSSSKQKKDSNATQISGDLISLASDDNHDDANKQQRKNGTNQGENYADGDLEIDDDNLLPIHDRHRHRADQNDSIPASPSDHNMSRLTRPTNINLSSKNFAISPTTPNREDQLGFASPRPPTAEHECQTFRGPMLYKYECKYGYHFATSPTSSMISELAKQVEISQKQPAASKDKTAAAGRNILSDEAKADQLKRLQEMFPTATGPTIEQIIRIYDGREGLIKAALISLGYKRAVGAADKQASVQNAILLMMAKQSSKRLYDKLAAYFPDREEMTIKTLMYELKEVEHEIISALVTSSPRAMTSGSQQRKDRTKSEYIDRRRDNAALMKVRFLKTLFPKHEEIELYNLLYEHDLNAQSVIAEMEKRGHKQVNINQVLASRKTQTQQAKARQQASRAAKDRPPGPNVVELHRSRPKPALNEAKAKSLKETIVKSRQQIALPCQTKDDGEEVDEEDDQESKTEPTITQDLMATRNIIDDLQSSDKVIALALQAAENNENLAKTFLDDLNLINDDQYTKRLDVNPEEGQRYVLFPSRGVQKYDQQDYESENIGSFCAPEYVSIPWEIVYCQNALALTKKDASTYTSDDFEAQHASHRLGPITNLAKGSLEKKLMAFALKQAPLQHGRDKHLSIGSSYKLYCDLAERRPPKQLAKGPNSLFHSKDRLSNQKGHNANLVQRMHPFYQKSKKKLVN